MNPLTSRFLSAFNQVERHLRGQAEGDQFTTFATLVDRVAQSNKAVRVLKAALKDFADLRNVLVHRYDQTKEIAIPSEEAVTRLEAIAGSVLAPPRLASLFRGVVETCSPADPVGAAARKMRERSFSQLPVYEDNRLVGLLTAETIARWLAARLDGGIGMLEEEPVAHVLGHQEKTRNHMLMGQAATVYDALAEFDEALHAGVTLEAILLTNSGQPIEKPLGIITVADMPQLVRAVSM
jgi:CBS domain-containing protein